MLHDFLGHIIIIECNNYIKMLRCQASCSGHGLVGAMRRTAGYAIESSYIKYRTHETPLQIIYDSLFFI